jgi:hypothetical protein
LLQQRYLKRIGHGIKFGDAQAGFIPIRPSGVARGVGRALTFSPLPEIVANDSRKPTKMPRPVLGTRYQAALIPQKRQALEHFLFRGAPAASITSTT